MRVWIIDIRARLLLGLVSVFLTVTSALAEQVAISFRDLPDPAAQDFDDPFRAMGLSDLEDLRTVVRLEARLKSEKFEAETRDRLAAQVIDARQSLAVKGYNIDALLASRWEVAANRKRARMATNPDYEGTGVALEGFLIPAGNDPDGASVGYLVSSVGMCSHKPTPPANQLVRVRYDGSFPSQNPYLPISIIGTLQVAPKDQTIFLLDGSARMVSMWELSAGQVTVNAPIGWTAGGSGVIDPLAMEQVAN